MKKVILSCLFLSTMLLVSKAQITTPQASPAATVSTVVGISDISVKYSRPIAKNRKIFGNGNEFLVPFGKMWRTGANSGTVITFADKVKIGGVEVPKGSYLLLTTPNQDEWTVILNKDLSMGGNLAKYNVQNDVVNIKVKPINLKDKVEVFTVNIGDISEKSDKANIQLQWENTGINIPIEVSFDEAVMKSIDLNTKINPYNYYQAAVYYLENGKDLNQALSWVNEYVKANPAAYWALYVKAKIQKELGQKNEAMETSKLSEAEAKKNNNLDYVKNNQDLQKSLK